MSRAPRSTIAVCATAAALAAIAGPAEAKPKRREAKVAFERGVAEYKKGNFDAAVEALSRSFEIERDVDTLFAWAQAERKLDHCDKASALYDKLLASNLPPANREAVEVKLAECRVILTQQAKDAAALAAPPPPPEPAPVEPAPSVAPPAPAAPARDDHPAATRAWYKDPVALVLVGGGVAAAGAGTGLLLSARSLDQDAKSARTYQDAVARSDQAKSRGTLGLITAGVGGALLVTGVVWIVTHRDSGEQPGVTAWFSPGGGGVAFAGAF